MVQGGGGLGCRYVPQHHASHREPNPTHRSAHNSFPRARRDPIVLKNFNTTTVNLFQGDALGMTDKPTAPPSANRTRAAWPDDSEPGEGPAQQQQQQLGAAAAISSGGRPGMAGDVGIERGFPPPERARTFDHTTAVGGGGGGGRGGVELEGGAAGLPRLLDAGNPEVRSVISARRLLLWLLLMLLTIDIHRSLVWKYSYIQRSTTRSR